MAQNESVADFDFERFEGPNPYHTACEMLGNLLGDDDSVPMNRKLAAEYFDTLIEHSIALESQAGLES